MTDLPKERLIERMLGLRRQVEGERKAGNEEAAKQLTRMFDRLLEQYALELADLDAAANEDRSCNVAMSVINLAEDAPFGNAENPGIAHTIIAVLEPLVPVRLFAQPDNSLCIALGWKEFADFALEFVRGVYRIGMDGRTELLEDRAQQNATRGEIRSAENGYWYGFTVALRMEIHQRLQERNARALVVIEQALVDAREAARDFEAGDIEIQRPDTSDVEAVHRGMQQARQVDLDASERRGKPDKSDEALRLR